MSQVISGEKPAVVVTGASRGIGHAIVKHFYDQGWDVITMARTPFSNVCPWAEGIVKHVTVDLSDNASIATATENLFDLLGDNGLQALINNAGISPKKADGSRMTASETDVETFLAVQQVNLVAPLVLSQTLLPRLTQVQGAIVNVSSIAASRTHPFAGAAYAVSKAALTTLTRELAHELAKTGVRVNSVAPGEIKTSILSPGTEEVVQSDVPMQRLGSPKEVAEVVYFLASSQSSYVTGSEIPINGGQHI
ncbi:MAG: SDR family oxidoreductase [Rhizobiaceae bacterium]|nr:SDR family oxidoreductase [Rhizobiaceae bacterium]